MKSLHMVAFVLLIVGGLNWGTSALGYNVVDMLLNSWPAVERIVYLLVGAAAIFELVSHRGMCKACTA